MEGMKTLPFGAVWDYHCKKKGVPVDNACLSEIEAYETKILEVRR